MYTQVSEGNSDGAVKIRFIVDCEERSSLTDSQKVPFDAIMESLHPDNIANFDDEPPVFIVLGGAGAGKSFLIDAIVEVVTKYLRRGVTCSAHATLAAKNIKGQSRHSLLSLGIYVNGQSKIKENGAAGTAKRKERSWMKPMQADFISAVALENVRARFKDVVLDIVDEVCS
jgi:hypothetical protein